MRAFAIATMLSLGFCANRVDAQVIGTYGTGDARLGYYSPYPGALYSPYRMPTPGYYPSNYRPNYTTGFPSGTMYAPRTTTFPRYGYGPFPNGNSSPFVNPNPYRRR